ncbi:FAD/NAD(P)-binding protein [Amycolatopsis magusensis]|uniref:FAD/NAD(P)-binding protein n=1 Tax=Amycolatopsis magusensis TaxID=882444 RepID=UPI0037A9582D
MTSFADGGRSVAVVGAGPRGVGLLERLAANAPEFATGPLTVHLIDPFPAGAGRVWRFAQSPLLRMNSMPEDVTMFTDDTVRCDGPIRPGPTLAEWVKAVASGELRVDLDPAVAAEVRAVTSTTFPTRRLQSAYLDWFHRHVLDSLPGHLRVRSHAARAVDITGGRGERQTVHFADAEPLTVDAVVLALGHLDAGPAPEEAELAAFAEAEGLRYYPPAYTADLDHSAIRPGESVLSRGFGLAFVDLLVLLTEGRGGRFTSGADGSLVYHPSGREPVLHVGSRRGVPYHAKPEYRLRGTPAPLPRFFGPPEVDELLARPGRLEFTRDIWPLMAKDIAWGYYHELFTGHPDRVRVDFAEFTACYADSEWGSGALESLVDKAVPDPADRFDPAAIDRPLAGLEFDGPAALTRYLSEYVEADLDRRANAGFSADLGAFLALLSVFGQLARLVSAGKLESSSQVDDVDGWWFGFFSFFASGPPGHRLRELLALVRAGVVRFTGPDLVVRARDGRFHGHSPAVPGGEVEATTLIEARLPAPSVRRAADPLVRALRDRGELTEEDLPGGRTTGRIRTTADGHLVGADGHGHDRRLALGPHTSARSPGAFTRPRTNGVVFRQNDAVARYLLTLFPSSVRRS